MHIPPKKSRNAEDSTKGQKEKEREKKEKEEEGEGWNE